MTRIKSAVILAAGLGSRLGDLKEDKPKAFIHVGGKSLIERSIELLLKKGIGSILIGTGYRSDYFEELKDLFPMITTFRNDIYDQTGSMYTLFNMRQLITQDILLLEGDLLYEGYALDCLLADERENIILASAPTHSGDEVFIECNGNGLLRKMSKEKSELENVKGELVGISKLSSGTVEAMCNFAEAKYKLNKMGIHYEDAMVGVSQQVDFHVRVEPDLAWCEIDDASHLRRATELVYPKIQQRD